MRADDGNNATLLCTYEEITKVKTKNTRQYLLRRTVIDRRAQNPSTKNHQRQPLDGHKYKQKNIVLVHSYFTIIVLST